MLALDTVLQAWPVLAVVGSVAGSAAAVKYTARETKHDLKALKQDFHDHVLADLLTAKENRKFTLEVVDRLARIETKVDELKKPG